MNEKVKKIEIRVTGIHMFDHSVGLPDWYIIEYKVLNDNLFDYFKSFQPFNEYKSLYNNSFWNYYNKYFNTFEEAKDFVDQIKSYDDLLKLINIEKKKELDLLEKKKCKYSKII